MTYGEFKESIKCLGFEEVDTMLEYDGIVRNACNMSLDHLYDDVVLVLDVYFKRQEGYERKRPSKITVDSPDSTLIELPDEVLPLLELLGAYYVWLDDDNVKSSYYWNAYETFRERIISSYLNDRKAKITGGVSW